jgi:transcriptional regulator with XRE-family HTH domain
MAKEKKSEATDQEKTAHLGARIKQLREELGITQVEMAALLNCTQGTIVFIENKSAFGQFTLKYLEFLDSKGYNISWIMISANEMIAKFKVFHDMEFVRQEMADKIQKLLEDNAEQKKQLDIVLTILKG